MRLSVIALLLSAALRAAIPIWIDTDPSVARGGHEVDDGFALLEAFRSPELSVRGVSVVFGNAPLDTAFPIGQQLVKEFGPPRMAVHRGAASAQDLGVETDASRALEAALRGEKLVVLAIGPLTNVATVLKQHPELAKRITKIVAVAGRRPHQRFIARAGARPFRDFNFEMDAPAFQVLLDSKVPLVLAPWEVSSKVWLRARDLATLRSKDPSLSWVLDAAQDLLLFWRKNFGTDGLNPFDTLAVGYVIAPDGFRCEQLPIAIKHLPDDTVAAGGALKPYLIAARELSSSNTTDYCFAPPPGFAETLVERIAHAQTSPIDESIWDKLTKKYVTPEARVDYAALKKETPRLDAYLKELAPKWPDWLGVDEREAALINAYNALTVRWILTNYPVESIWRTKHPFTEARYTIDGQRVSLDQIEGQLRAMGDPRIHSALVCASRSCPPLRREAYQGSRLNEQLDANFHDWLANGRLNEFSVPTRTASVSMIFKWYGDDFRKNDGSVEKYLARYGPGGQVKFLSEPGSRIEYKPYNWGLNDTSNHGSHYSQENFYWDALRNK
ncbi:MAG TPA: nucleoside hydrolase [Bryobacteraceae bacterium]